MPLGNINSCSVLKFILRRNFYKKKQYIKINFKSNRIIKEKLFNFFFYYKNQQ